MAYRLDVTVQRQVSGAWGAPAAKVTVRVCEAQDIRAGVFFRRDVPKAKLGALLRTLQEQYRLSPSLVEAHLRTFGEVG